MLNKSSGVIDDLNGQDWEKKRGEIWEYREAQKWMRLGLHWDIALAMDKVICPLGQIGHSNANGQSNTKASQCLSHYPLLATSHMYLLKTWWPV